MDFEVALFKVKLKVIVTKNRLKVMQKITTHDRDCNLKRNWMYGHI